MSYTKGPWKTSGFSISAKGSGHIAKALEIYMDRTTREANACLIAAAPELLEALDILYGVIWLTPVLGNKEALQEAMDHAWAVMKKAEGKQP